MKKLMFYSIGLLIISNDMFCNQQVSQHEDARKLLTLKDKEYFEVDDKRLSELRSDLLDIDYYGIALTAPKIINTTNQDDLPLLVGIRYSGERGWNFPVREKSFIIATDLSTGNVSVCDLYQDVFLKDKEPESEKRDKSVLGTLAKSAAIVSCENVRNILRLPWEKGEWSFSILYYDWISNSINVVFDGKESNENIPPQSIYPPRLRERKVPDYSRTDQSPEMPETGIQFKCNYDTTGYKKTLFCTGSYHIDAKKYHFIINKQNNTIINDGIIAIIPVTLIIMATEFPYIFSLDYHFPVYENEKDSLEKKLSGYFTVDVLDHSHFSDFVDFVLPSDIYLAYMCIDGIVYGPQKITVK